MARGYGQYCPLSLASELLCQRWTVLVVSRVMLGCTRFNAIQRSLPQMSPSLLSQRLTELERAGILSVARTGGGRVKEYRLTEAGAELAPLVDAMATWGQRWARDMEPEDLDPAFLVWSLHTRFDATELPAGRTVIAFRFSDAPANCREFWLVCEDGDVQMCLKDPGYEEDLRVASNLRVFIETWRGFRNVRNELRSGRIRVHGPRNLRARFPGCLRLHSHAAVERMRPGRERRLSRITSPRVRDPAAAF
jgi:DNA-binding HxlR family transcriptional regulator